MPVFILFFIGVAVLLAVSTVFSQEKRGWAVFITAFVLALASNSILGLILLADSDTARTVESWFAGFIVFLVPNVVAASTIYVLSRRSVSVAVISIITCVTATIGLAVGIWLGFIAECSQRSCM